jgi:hypothetical protein
MSKRSKKWQLNKRAFDEICGDPYGFPEPIQGHYAMLKGRSSISVITPEQKASPSAVNKAKPNIVDFCCDVDSCIEDAMSTMQDGALDVFINTYIVENDLHKTFDQKERAKVEQLVGNILVQRKIYPVVKYFTAVRQ